MIYVRKERMAFTGPIFAKFETRLLWISLIRNAHVAVLWGLAFPLITVNMFAVSLTGSWFLLIAIVEASAVLLIWLTSRSYVGCKSVCECSQICKINANNLGEKGRGVGPWVLHANTTLVSSHVSPLSVLFDISVNFIYYEALFCHSILK
jgi:hypothetical protein